MTIQLTNAWGEFKRKNPEGAENVTTLILQTISVIIVVVCAYYALKFKPFHSVSFQPAPVAHNREHKSAVQLLMPVKISLVAEGAQH